MTAHDQLHACRHGPQGPMRARHYTALVFLCGYSRHWRLGIDLACPALHVCGLRPAFLH